MKNYAGHRLSPWLGHLMVSRSETARPLLTAGEVMQLPPADEIVMVSGLYPIRAKKARYFEDERTISGLVALLQSNALKQALAPYCLGGSYGRLLDADAERLGDADVVVFETEGLIGSRDSRSVAGE